MALVVVTGKAGKSPDKGSVIVTVPTDSKKDAYAVAEKFFRKKYDVPSNVTLRSTVVFEGSEKACGDFHELLLVKLQNAEVV